MKTVVNNSWTSSHCAEDWADATPLGNGRIGAMLYGDPKVEHIALNHDLLWRSYIRDTELFTYRDADAIRAAGRRGDYKEVSRLFRKTLPHHERGCVYINPFVPFCDLFVRMMLKDSAITDYSRSLDMEHGVGTVSFVSDGVTYTRECFCPVGKPLCILRLKSNVAATLTGEISLSRLPDAECTVTGTLSFGELTLHGAFDEGRSFAASVRVLHRNGRLALGKRTYGIEGEPSPERHFGLGYVFDRDKNTEPERGTSLYFDSCDEVSVVIALATDVECDDPIAHASHLSRIERTAIDGLQAAHERAFADVFSRTALSFDIPADTRASTALAEEACSVGKMTSTLLTRLWQMARYTAIASGMPQGEDDYPKAPINLQGIWNRDTRPAWESDYHPDLNIEMCYQPLPAVGLVEWMEPFLAFVERTLPAAKKRAKEMFGAVGAHYVACYDAEGNMSPTDTILCGFLSGGAWFMQMLWQYYEYAPSDALLRRIYAFHREVSAFLLFMLEEDGNGRLTFPFGSSPEMGLILEGEVQYVGSASTIDLSLTREVLLHTARAAELLGDDPTPYRTAAERIRPLPIDGNGRLMEWVAPHEEEQPGHRHRSPFVAFCPGNSITKRNAPETVAAMERLLDHRRAAGTSMCTSFSYSLDAQLLARFGRGDEAFESLFPLARFHVLENGLLTTNDHLGRGGMTWFAHVKVMQMEALLGILGVVHEMLLSDADGIITPLFALPTALPSGSYKGALVRCGFSVDLSWKHGKLTELTLRSTYATECRVKLPDGTLPTVLPDGASLADGILTFPTKATGAYTLVF